MAPHHTRHRCRPPIARHRVIAARLALSSLLALAVAPAARADDPVPRIEVPAAVVPANDQFHWVFAIKIVNPTEGGIYCDSLSVDVEDLDPGELRLPRRRPFTTPAIARYVPSISALDSAVFRFESMAFAERARLHLRLYSHTAKGRLHASDAMVLTAPGAVWSAFAPRLESLGKETIEYVHLPEVWPTRPSPGILLVHGEGSNARHQMPLAWDLVNRGYAVLCVSLPGYGLSTAPPDFCGPRSLAVVGRAFDLLRRTGGVDSSRVALWGVSHGANVVARLAARRDDVKAVVLQSGIFDLEATYAAAQVPAIREVMEQDAGPRKGWKARSATAQAARIRAPVLVLHGAEDPAAPIAQADAFVAALQKAGRSPAVRRLRGTHLLPLPAVRDSADAFLAPLLETVRR